jgi:hypothetical protein
MSGETNTQPELKSCEKWDVNYLTQSRRAPTTAFGEATFDQLSGSCCSKAIAYGGAGMLSNIFAVVIRDVSVA